MELILCMLAVGQSSGLDPACTWIIGGLCGAILAESIYIVKLHGENKEILKEWVKSAQDELHMLNLVRNATQNSGSGDSGGKR